MRIFVPKSMIAALIVLPASALAFDQDAAQEMCKTQWPGDFFMQKSCVDLQREGFEGLPGAVSGLPDDVAAEIRATCAAQWSTDFFLQKSCVDLQREGVEGLQGAVSGLPDDVAAEIRATCAAQWSTDFFVQKSCVDLQVEAWRDLNG